MPANVLIVNALFVILAALAASGRWSRKAEEQDRAPGMKR